MDADVHFPPYDFWVANSMVTQLPACLSPTLLMLVAAYGGYSIGDESLSHHSVKGDLPFSGLYGDAMLIFDK